MKSVLSRSRGVLLVVALSLFGYLQAAADELKLSPAQISALGIETASIVAAQRGEREGFAAQVVIPNEQQRVVAAPLAGLIERLFVAAHEPVRRGQLLSRLQSSGLADIQHTYLQALTQRELAKSQLDRDERLYVEGIIAESRLQATRARWIEVSADAAERTQALRLAGLDDRAIDALAAGRRVGTTIDLVAPIDGVVLEQLVVVGQRVEAATPIVKVARLDPLWLEIQVPTARLAGVREGTAVSIPSMDVTARVLTVGRSINPANQTVSVRAVTSRGAAKLRPGQSLEVVMATDAAPGHWLVPNIALTRSGSVAHVFVQTAGGFRAQSVRVVAEGAERSVVAGALVVTDRIAVKGVAALKAAAGRLGGD